MSILTPRESELVSLAAALAANCVPCIEVHIPKARAAGLSDAEIRAAIELADTVRQVPARKVLDTAWTALGAAGGAKQEGGACAGMAKAGGMSCC